MRYRDIRIGMHVEHAVTGKRLGRVIHIGDVEIRLDNRDLSVATCIDLAPSGAKARRERTKESA
jgi:hypothetical protein